MKNPIININNGSDSKSNDNANLFNEISKSVIKLFTSIGNSSFEKLLKIIAFSSFMCLIIGSLIFAIKISENTQLINNIANKAVSYQEENRNMNIRMAVTPKIKKEIEKTMYKIGADRIFVMEMHNGKENPTGMPFKFADMDYEEVNTDNDITKIWKSYQQMPLSQYSMPFYIMKNGMCFGYLNKIRSIDRDFADIMEQHKGKFFAGTYIVSDGTEIGFLCVVYNDSLKIRQNEILTNLEQCKNSIAPLLDLAKQKKLYNENSSD